LYFIMAHIKDSLIEDINALIIKKQQQNIVLKKIIDRLQCHVPEEIYGESLLSQAEAKESPLVDKKMIRLA
jgi:hypothetical protein